MESCWAGQPSQRPLLGLVEPVIQSIKLRYEQGKSVMPDRLSLRKKKTHRMPSWPNQDQDLKLENLPIHQDPPMPRIATAEGIITNTANENKTTEPQITIHPPPEDACRQAGAMQDMGIAIGLNDGGGCGGLAVTTATDIDRTVYMNRDQLMVTNVFLEPSSFVPNGDIEYGTGNNGGQPLVPTGNDASEMMTNGISSGDNQDLFPMSMPFVNSSRQVDLKNY